MPACIGATLYLTYVQLCKQPLYPMVHPTTSASCRFSMGRMAHPPFTPAAALKLLIDGQKVCATAVHIPCILSLARACLRHQPTSKGVCKARMVPDSHVPACRASTSCAVGPMFPLIPHLLGNASPKFPL